MDVKVADQRRIPPQNLPSELEMMQSQSSPVSQLPPPTKFSRTDKGAAKGLEKDTSIIRLECKKIHHRNIGQKILESNEGSYRYENSLWSSVYIQNLNQL